MQYLMPLLLILLLILVTYACAVGDVRSTISFLFSFNPELLTPKVIVSAMGHAFFTLALGAGAMITYGAYTHSKTPLVSSVAMIALLDTLVALLAGLAIFPIVFLHQLAPNQGPLLMFVSLPMAFSQMPMGEYLSALFFLFLAVSAWTSSINILETPVAILTSQFNLTRTRACTLIAIISWTLGLGSVFSFNWLKNWTFWDLTFFDLMTLIPDRLILPIGGLCFALIIGYLISRQTLEEALPLKNKIFTSILRTVLRIIAPLTIVIILLSPYIFSDYP